MPVFDYDEARLGEERKFFTYHAVREQSEELYGFSSLTAKRLFELLISVQGIGPKAGIAILSLERKIVQSISYFMIRLTIRISASTGAIFPMSFIPESL